jgi:hypothetical protein
MNPTPIHVDKLRKLWREYGHDIQSDIESGGKFRKFSYTVSLIAFTITKDDIYYVPSGCRNPGKHTFRNIITLALG